MKKHWSKKALVPSILSLLVIGAFIFMGVISLEMQYQSVEYKGGGTYEAYNDVSPTERTTYTGPIDNKDRWHGYTTIVHYDGDPPKLSHDYVGIRKTTEYVWMEHGKREGKSTTTYEYEDGTSRTDDRCCYVNGIWKYKPSATKSVSEATSTFQLLQDTYPWFLTQLLAFNYDSTYVDSYLNKMDSILNTHIYGDTLFFDFYDDALNQLAETPYDSIVELQAMLTFQLGMEEMKDNEYRQAVVDRFWAGAGSSYGIVETMYKPYLHYLNEVGVSDPDFAQFCHVLDSTMDSYAPLDPLDPFYIDSIDSYLYMSISEIMETEEDSVLDNPTLKKSAVPLDEFINISKSLRDMSSLDMFSIAGDRNAEVAEIVGLSMYMYILEGDIIGKVAEQAWMKNQSLATLPTVATELVEHTSATSVTLRGYIIDEGGADITANGIVWATYHNPSLDDNRVDAAPGSEDFTFTLDGLDEGSTYYTRTYATNSVGTAYGNSIEFTAKSTIGTKPKETNHTLDIYPNPTSGVTSIRVYSPSQETLFLTLIDLKGSIVFKYPLDVIPGDNTVQVDLSFLKGGIYLGQLRSDSDIRASAKLIILK